ncbi:MAG: TIGR00730 family Rossman fold protein [Pseudomonadota bacterium]
MKSICVYCGSSPGDDPAFSNTAKEIGQLAAERDWRVVYGGGRMGLMGDTASSARDHGGKVYGVIPKFLTEIEGILEGVEHKIVETMHERKMLMFEEADVFCTLPGGIGTLEEIIETLSWARLSLHHKPIIVANINDFWSPLEELLNHIVDRQFAPDFMLKSIEFVNSAEAVFDAAEDALLRNKA